MPDDTPQPVPIAELVPTANKPAMDADAWEDTDDEPLCCPGCLAHAPR